MKRFDLLRACFYLIGIVALGMMLETLIALTACTFVVIVQHADPPGKICEQVGASVTTLFSELLAAVLALLVASRPPGPPTPPPAS